MSALTVLIDTDVLIDFLTARGAFTKNVKAIIQKSQEQTVRVFLVAHSITNIFYILRKIYSVSERKQHLMDLCRSVSVVDIGYELIVSALANNDFAELKTVYRRNVPKPLMLIILLPATLKITLIRGFRRFCLMNYWKK